MEVLEAGEVEEGTAATAVQTVKVEVVIRAAVVPVVMAERETRAASAEEWVVRAVVAAGRMAAAKVAARAVRMVA